MHRLEPDNFTYPGLQFVHVASEPSVQLSSQAILHSLQVLFVSSPYILDGHSETHALFNKYPTLHPKQKIAEPSHEVQSV